MALGSYLVALFPELNPTIVGSVFIIIFHILHGKKLYWGTIFQDWTTAIKIGLIILFIIAGLLVSDVQPISVLPKSGDGNIILSSGFAVGLVWVSYAYTGWNSSVYIAGEMKEPGVDIPRSILLSTSFVMLLYVLLNFIFLYTTPLQELIGEVEIGYISGQHVFGYKGAKVIALGISILLISTVSSYVYIGPRIMKTMGEDYKYLRLLSKTDDQGIPVYAFWVQLVICLLFILSSSFEQVLMYTGISLILTTTATVFSVFILRIKEPDLHRPYRTWGYPWTPIFFILVNLWILYYTFLEQTFESIVGMGIVILSFGLYYLGRNFK